MKTNNIKKLVVVVGPTAVGKTALCVNLAKHFQCDIISCDSRQFYREMSIGTAKPSQIEMDGIKHHFINSHSITDYYSAGDYERDVGLFLDSYFLNNNVAILTGGSGLFVKAVLEGLDEMPEIPSEIRLNLMQELENNGLEILQNRLKNTDFETFNKIDIFNTQRLVRALEVFEATGVKFSDYQKQKTKKLPFEVVKIGLTLNREVLYNRINMRVDDMLKIGLIEEVRTLIVYRNHNALKTVGYKEVFMYFENAIDYTTMIDLIKRNTRRYAKRQLTWFKNQDNFTWFDPSDFDSIIEYVNRN